MKTAVPAPGGSGGKASLLLSGGEALNSSFSPGPLQVTSPEVMMPSSMFLPAATPDRDGNANMEEPARPPGQSPESPVHGNGAWGAFSGPGQAQEPGGGAGRPQGKHSRACAWVSMEGP